MQHVSTTTHHLHHPTTPPPTTHHDHITTHARVRAWGVPAVPSRSARRGRSNAAASDLHKEVDAREGAVVGQAAGLASGARCQV